MGRCLLGITRWSTMNTWLLAQGQGTKNRDNKEGREGRREKVVRKKVVRNGELRGAVGGGCNHRMLYPRIKLSNIKRR